jgi:hypothetical protein
MKVPLSYVWQIKTSRNLKATLKTEFEFNLNVFKSLITCIMQIFVQHIFSPSVTFFSMQEVPEQLIKMAKRFDAWKEKKDQERMDVRGYRSGNRGGFGGGSGGGRYGRGKW